MQNEMTECNLKKQCKINVKIALQEYNAKR